MNSLEEQLRERRDAILEKLTAAQRTALEMPGSLPAQETAGALLDMTAGIWLSLFEIAAEIDKLKG